MSSSGDPGLMAPLMLLAVPLGHLQKQAGAAWSDLLLIPAPHPHDNAVVSEVISTSLFMGGRSRAAPPSPHRLDRLDPQ